MISEGGDWLVCLHLAFGKIGFVRLASALLYGVTRGVSNICARYVKYSID